MNVKVEYNLLNNYKSELFEDVVTFNLWYNKEKRETYLLIEIEDGDTMSIPLCQVQDILCFGSKI